MRPQRVSAHAESQEFANGLVELMRVAHDFDKDRQRPESSVSVSASGTAGHVTVMFNLSESAAVFSTLDGSAPSYSSTMLASPGIREGAETLTIGTTIHWFSVDSAGNVERNDKPDGMGKNYNKIKVKAVS